MPITTLTDITLRNLKPVPGKQITYLDKSLKGFGVRVTESGAMSYVLTYGPNRKRIKLGDVRIIKLGDARTKAKTILAERQLGVHRSDGAATYHDALETFLDAVQAKNKPRTYRDYKRLLTRHGFGHEKLSSITSVEIEKKLAKLPPGEQAHAYAALNIFFRSCVRRRLLDRNPLDHVEKPPKRKSRERILSDDELKTVWNAATGMFGDIVRLCIATGQRRSEIAQLQWSWIRDDLVTLPPQITKNGREHTFPIGPIAAAIIARQTRRNDTDYVFPAREWGQGNRASCYGSWGRDKAALDKASGVTNWVLHDLRRTFRSKWAELGILREVAEKYINHVSGVHAGVGGIYDRFSYLEPMRNAVKRYESWLQSLLPG
jgi:integrase